jgi:hypothetical protein
MDQLGKGLGQMLLEYEIALPRAVISEAEPTEAIKEDNASVVSA